MKNDGRPADAQRVMELLLNEKLRIGPVSFSGFGKRTLTTAQCNDLNERPVAKRRMSKGEGSEDPEPNAHTKESNETIGLRTKATKKSS